jgi:hypothetical protein
LTILTCATAASPAVENHTRHAKERFTVTRLKISPARCGIYAILGLLLADTAAAIDIGDSVQLHGFGSQDYAQTTDNKYLDADKKGTWNNNFLGLVGTVSVTDKMKVWAQLETSTDDVTRFTWAFVDYQFSDAFSAQVGRIKFPSGLYNETVDTTFLQLSSITPDLYRGAADFVHDSYTGVGIRYDKALGSGRLTWQIYAGQNFDPDQDPILRDRQMQGTRLTYATPIDGLRFMVSFNHGQVQILTTDTFVPEQRAILSGDYTAHDWDIKSEYATHQFQHVNSNSYYLQVGRTFLERWTPFARYDVVNLDRTLEGNDSFTEKSVVAGLGYKLLGNVSLRGEAHLNRGYALPVASGEVIQGEGTRNWTMVVFGVHFIF